VSKALRNELEEERRRKLREDLIAGYREKAEEDLEICREWDADLARWCELIDQE
jgi:hypothetical protein